MSKNRFLLLLLTIAWLAGCSHNHLSTDSLPVIDVTKNYPEREIKLSDIADITYVHLDSKDDDFLYRGSIRYITENTFVVNDAVTNSFLFFSKDGAPKSRFNHYGNGPEEYWGMGSLIVYDEKTDEVFIGNIDMNSIQVYSSEGEYRRKLPLPHGVMLSQMDFFDSQSLIVYDDGRRLYKAQPKSQEDNMDYLTHSIDSSFFLISKADGQVDYIQISASQNDLSFKSSSGNPMMISYTNIVKHTEGVLLCNPETDTVFLYNKNRDLTPVICKIPLVDKTDPKIILNNCIDIDTYQFMEIQIVSYNDLRGRNNKYFLRVKKTGEIFRQKIVIPDYKEKEIMISSKHAIMFPENITHVELDLIELKQAYRENKLGGKLKEMVATLNENEDNNVFMLVHFK